MWTSASDGLKSVVVKKNDESVRGDYESVLKVGSESFNLNSSVGLPADAAFAA